MKLKVKAAVAAELQQPRPKRSEFHVKTQTHSNQSLKTTVSEGDDEICWPGLGSHDQRPTNPDIYKAQTNTVPSSANVLV